MSRLCPVPGCPTLLRPNERRCSRHDQRAAYRDPAYVTARREMLTTERACCDCGSTDDLTVDHVQPLSRGGTNDPANLRVRCRSCNSSKGDKAA